MAMGKHLEFIMREMCARVGADFDSMDFKSRDWYTTYTWTADEEDAFIDWLADYLYRSAEARREIMTNPRKNKQAIRGTISWFILAYGWKCSDNVIPKVIE